MVSKQVWFELKVEVPRLVHLNLQALKMNGPDLRDELRDVAGIKSTDTQYSLRSRERNSACAQMNRSIFTQYNLEVEGGVSLYVHFYQRHIVEYLVTGTKRRRHPPWTPTKKKTNCIDKRII